MDFPEVPKVPLQPSAPRADVDEEFEIVSRATENLHVEPQEPTEKQFVPFIAPPSLSSASFSASEESKQPPPFSRTRTEIKPTNPLSRTKTETDVDLNDVLAAAQAAADSAERAAAAARSAASLAEIRIAELKKRSNDLENPFHTDDHNPTDQSVQLARKSSSESDSVHDLNDSPYDNEEHQELPEASKHPSFDTNDNDHQPQRMNSMEDNPFSYPSLFTSQDSYVSGSLH